MTEPRMSFAERNFGAADLGDERRTRRLPKLVEQMIRHPGGTLPQKLPRPEDLEAFSRLCDAEDVTHEAVVSWWSMSAIAGRTRLSSSNTTGSTGKQLTHRSDSPWDTPDRRPSHADRRKALQTQCLLNDFSHASDNTTLPKKIRSLLQRLLRLAV